MLIELNGFMVGDFTEFFMVCVEQLLIKFKWENKNGVWSLKDGDYII